MCASWIAEVGELGIVVEGDMGKGADVSNRKSGGRCVIEELQTLEGVT